MENKEQLINKYRYMENKEQLINKYRAEFENACDDLYYGYGYKFWRTHNNSIEDDNIAKMVWKAAFNKMSANESKTKNMKKNTVKINEGQLKKIVAESVKKVLKEEFDNEDDDIFITAYNIIQSGIYEIVEKHSVTPTVAVQELTKVLNTYDADDIYDDDEGDY